MATLAPVYNRDGSQRMDNNGSPLIADWRDPLIANGTLWIAAGKLPTADHVTQADLEKLELDSPFKRLGVNQSPNDLAFTKAREVLIVTRDNKLILLQRSPWAASVGQLQSTGGGFTGVIDGRAETVAETLKAKLQSKHGVSIDTDDLYDLNCTTIGGGITTFKGLDKDGVLQVGGTAEILESYVMYTGLTADGFVNKMRPTYGDIVGVVILDLSQIGAIATEKFVPADFVANSLYTEILDPIPLLSDALPLGLVYEEIVRLSHEKSKPPKEELSKKGTCPAWTTVPAIIDVAKLFHPRTVPVLFAVAQAVITYELPAKAKATLSEFRKDLAEQKKTLDARATSVAFEQGRPSGENAPQTAP